MKKLTPEEINKILKENNISKKEFIDTLRVCDCEFCFSDIAYIEGVILKSENNPTLKEALDHIFENTERSLRCPSCGEIIYEH